MFELSGLDKLTQDLKDAEAALASLDGELGSVHFDPEDPASIEQAIRDVNLMLEERAGEYSSNPIVGPILDRMKETYRDQILQRAAVARSEGKDNHE